MVFELFSLFNLSYPFAITSLIGCKITNAEMTHFRCHWLFVNMPFSKEDKILITNLFELKVYNARYLVRVSQKKLGCQQHLQIVAIAMGYWLVDRRPGSG